MKIILGSHWTNPPEGWTSLTEQDQDMLKPLQWEDNSIDVIFSEHAAMEHLPFIGGIGFLKESLRVLKPDGVLRIVCPFLEQLCGFVEDGKPLTRNFIKTQVSHYYRGEFAQLEELGIDPLEHGKQFMLDSLFKGHNHRMIWSAQLLQKVLWKIGFSHSNITTPGKSMFLPPSDCLERRIRGLDVEYLNNIGVEVPKVYDPESMVVEAIK